MKYISLLITLFGFSQFSFSKSPTPVQFTTSEIPPFMGQELPEQGAAAFALKEAFKAINCDLQLKFYPIKRARTEASKNPEVIGFIPATASEGNEGFVVSKAVFHAKTLIVENAEHPIVWSKPEDLGKYRGGLVLGYSLKSPIKEIYDQGKLKLEESPDELSNILKVANGRLDYVFINDGMYKFLTTKEPRLKEVLHKLHVNAKPAAIVNWGLAFKKDSPIAQKLLKEFNDQTDEKQVNTSILEYIKKIEALASNHK